MSIFKIEFCLNVPFQKKDESPYNPEFVAKIKASMKSAEKAMLSGLKIPKIYEEYFIAVEKKDLEVQFKSGDKASIKRIHPYRYYCLWSRSLWR